MPACSIERHITPDDLAKSLRAEVRAGLTSTPKAIPPRWLYDARGSELFERITALDEYYPTRAERAILSDQAAEIASATEAATLIELGSGSSEKTRLLLDALFTRGSLRRYVPVDVSESALVEASGRIAADYPGITVHGLVDDFARTAEALPDGDTAGTSDRGGRLVAVLGGTIGNLLPAERAEFLTLLRAGLEPSDTLLLGTDLVKAPDRLVAAYDDAAGVTAEFELNILRVLNRELGADFPTDGFGYVASWDAAHERIDMRLRSLREQTVHVPELGLSVALAEGEEILTEVSSKFRKDGVAVELEDAGFTMRHWWTDDAGDFALSLAVPT